MALGVALAIFLAAPRSTSACHLGATELDDELAAGGPLVSVKSQDVV